MHNYGFQKNHRGKHQRIGFQKVITFSQTYFDQFCVKGGVLHPLGSCLSNILLLESLKLILPESLCQGINVYPLYDNLIVNREAM